MAQALLASPSVGYSPDSSFDSNSSSSSPRLPALSSPFSGETPLPAFAFAEDSTDNTPTRAVFSTPMSGDTPAWMTDDLDEEWVEEEQSPLSPRSSNLVVAQHSNNNSLSPAGSGTTGSPTVRAASSNDSTTAKYQPRVPSSLRYATGSVVFADADGDNVDDASGSVLRQPQHDSTRTRSPVSSTGTFVVRSNPTTARDGEGEGNEQLQAAVRALQGPSAGLGAVEQVEDGELELPSRSPKKGKDKLGGLMKLFEPPSPPAASAVPPSTISAPSSDEFNFTPPVTGARTSWKSLPHFTPTNSATPVARPQQKDLDETPSRPVARHAPAPKVKERYLHRSVIDTEEKAQSPEELHPSGNEPDAWPFPSTPAQRTPQPPSDAQPPGSALKLFEFQYDTFTRNHLVALVDEIDELGAGTMGGVGVSRPDAMSRANAENLAWETSFVDAVSLAQRDEITETSTDQEDAGRSTKRIRLSPAAAEPHGSRECSARRRSRRPSGGRRSAERRSGGFRTQLGASASSSHRVGTSPSYAGFSARRRGVHPPVFEDSHSPSATSRTLRTRAESPQHGVESATGTTMTTRERIDDANALLDRIRAKKAAAQLGASHGLASGDHSPEVGKSLASRAMARDPSPRKLLRRLSASDEVDEEIRPSRLAGSKDGSDRPLSLPQFAAAASASLRSALVKSSSQASPADTALTGHRRQASEPGNQRHFARTPLSAQKPIKRRSQLGEVFPHNNHPPAPNAGATTARKVSDATAASSTPGHVRHTSLTTIGPGEFEALLASATAPSRMVFNRDEGRWVKMSRGPAPTLAGTVIEEDESRAQDHSSSTEDDPFRDFDSTRASGDISRLTEARADTGGLAGLGISAGTPVAADPVDKPQVFVSPPDKLYFEPLPPDERADSVELVLESEPEESVDVASWGNGESKRRQLQGDAQAEEAVEEESPLALFREAMQGSQAAADAVHRSDAGEGRTATVAQAEGDSTSTFNAAAAAHSTIPSTPRPLVAAVSLPSMPRSALKQPVRSQSAPVMAGTPMSEGSETRPPRSVSFSDGKTNGKIEGLVVERGAEAETRQGSRLKFELSTKSVSDSEASEAAPTGFLGEPGSLRMDEELDDDHEHESPSSRVSMRAKHGHNASRELQASFCDSLQASTSLVKTSSGNTSKAPQRADRVVSHSRTFRRTTRADATFMTECSFGVSADKLVQFITDVEPFEPDWESLHSINLAKKGVESVVRLKDFLPSLHELNLADNSISFLTGIPEHVRTLIVPNNRLSGLTAYGHLSNLQRLDISNNQVDSVHQLSCLHHLREIKADGNRICDLAGLADISGLLRLSLKDNAIESLDLSATSWSLLETLNLSRNKISVLVGAEKLQSLALLNLDHNRISSFAPADQLPRLRVLRLSHNPIDELDVTFAPKLRTLFIDSARLGNIYGTESLRKLENLSVRDQSGEAMTLSMSHVRDIKRFYLSGNPVPTSFPSEKFFNLVYLELAMCQITVLPDNLSSVVPNVRTLNLSHNFIEDLSPLSGLTRLNNLTMIGARIGKCRPITQVLSTMPELESVDLRMNPLTLSFYPPFTSPPTTLLPSHAEHQILHPDDEKGATVEGTGRSSSWTAIDKRFRRALPDEYYFKRASYRAVLLQVVPTLRRLDGVDCSKERPKLSRVLQKMAERRQEL